MKRAMLLVAMTALLLPVMAGVGVAGGARTFYFACGHPSEGLHGLTGPSRGTYQDAQKDEQSHLNSHPDHKGHTTVVTNQ